METELNSNSVHSKEDRSPGKDDYKLPDIDFKTQLDKNTQSAACVNSMEIPLTSNEAVDTSNTECIYEVPVPIAEMQPTFSVKQQPEKSSLPQIGEAKRNHKYFHVLNTKIRRNPQFRYFIAIAAAALVLGALALLLTLIQFGTTSNKFSDVQTENGEFQKSSNQEINNVLAQQNISYTFLRNVLSQQLNYSESKFANTDTEIAAVWNQLNHSEESHAQFHKYSADEINRIWTNLNLSQKILQLQLNNSNEEIHYLRAKLNQETRNLTENLRQEIQNELNNSTNDILLQLNNSYQQLKEELNGEIQTLKANINSAGRLVQSLENQLNISK